MSTVVHRLPREAGGGYERVILGTVCLTVVVSYGTLFYAFGVLVVPIHHELGWSRATISAAFSIALLTSALLAWPAGHFLDRRSPRAVMSCGSALAVVALRGWS